MKNAFFFIVIVLLSLNINAQSSQNALHFDGSNDYVQTTFPAITGNSARTIEAWIKTTSNSNPSASGVQHIITDMGNFVTGGRFTFNVLWSNAIRVEVGGSGLSGTIAVNDGNWHHVACVYNPTATNKISLYVDGTLDIAGNITTPVNTSTGTMRIGRRIDNARQWEGDIDEVRVWNFAKTATQIAAIKDEEICSSQTGLAAYYRCNEGTANGSNSNVTTLIDNSSGTNNGTLTNFGLSGSSSNWVTGVNITAAPNSDTILNVEACGNYSTPGGTFVANSGTYTESLTNHLGCDSILTINVTIKGLSFLRDTIQACDSFRSTQGTLYNSTRIYSETFTNQGGCDSIVQTFLTIGNSTLDTQNIVECYSYTSPSGKTWNTSGTYTDAMNSVIGCDSVVVINLTIKDSVNTTISDTACAMYTSTANTRYFNSGSYREILMNAAGCDSIVTLHLLIHAATDSTIITNACDSFTSESGNSLWFTSGRYTEQLLNSNSCDSTITYVLTVNSATSSSLTYDVCEPFTSPGGILLNTSGIYTDVLVNSAGCDSTLMLNVTITENNPIVSKNGENLEVDIPELSYQWLDCNDANSPIANATMDMYRPSVSGDYAVETTENSCRDTSECINYPRTAYTAHLRQTLIALAPNPANNSVRIISLIDYNYILFNHLGQSLSYGNTSEVINVIHLQNGIYYIKVITEDTIVTLPLIIEHGQY